MVEGRYWLQTLGCPKNQVDSDKLAGRLARSGLSARRRPAEADLVVVNTCAFIESARQESIETVLELADQRRAGARLVVTGCMAERYGDELTEALPEVDLVAGFGVRLADPPTRRRRCRRRRPRPLGRRRAPPTAGFDLLELARPASEAPWAYVKVAEGCDRICGFCAIPSFRGKQRSRAPTRSWPRWIAPGRRIDAGRTPRRRCARSCWWPRTSPPTAATARGRASG